MLSSLTLPVPYGLGKFLAAINKIAVRQYSMGVFIQIDWS